MPDYTLLPFPIFQRPQLFFNYLCTCCLYQCNTSTNHYFLFQHMQICSYHKALLHQWAVVGDQNGIQILGLYCFVSEEFDYNVANYISSQIRLDLIRLYGLLQATFQPRELLLGWFPIDQRSIDKKMRRSYDYKELLTPKNSG